jgi:geranylgeranyl diphosphate synthase type II
LYLDERRRLVEECLVAYLLRETDCPPRLLEALRYSLLAPGKRVRPLMVLLAAEACGEAAEAALPAACALEMVHAYSLVHDDLPAMDDDDLRRGRATCHKQFDEATAILVGDGLLTLAFQVLAQDVRPPALATACVRELARAAGVAGMVGGQMADLEGEGSANDRISRLEAIHRRKTGALFRAALRLGGMIGCHSESVRGAALTCLDRYGELIGLAFQIADDLIDVESTAAQAGKRVGKDASRGKLTYPGLLGVEESRRRLTQVCQEARQSIAELGPAGRRLVEFVELVERRDR